MKRLRKPAADSKSRHVFGVLAILVGAAVNFDYAFAVSMEQAIAQCKQQVAPVVRACARRKMAEKGGSPDQYIPECKAPVMGQFNSCLAELIGAAGFKQKSVHSASARELVTDLFRHQTADPTLTRGEALRQAMMALLDGKGFTDVSGKTLFTYAHPLFWGPYSIIGDGG
jgi:hypothetical protein